MTKLNERLKELRTEKQLTQSELAKILGVAKTTISMYENDNSTPNDDIKKKISEYFKVSIDYLTGNSPYRNWEEYDSKLGEKRLQQITDEVNFYKNLDQSKRGVKIPVLGTVAAGIPISAHEYILDYEEIPTELANKGVYFGLKIKGASMEPAFYDGDTVIVRQQDDVENNEIAVVLINGDEATVKQIKKTNEGVTLIGYNVAVFTPKFFTNQEIIDLPVRIVGKVVELRRTI